MVTRHTIIPASYMIFRKQNNILLLRRCNTGWEDGNYTLPAGHVEEGESFTQTAIRDTLEETGLIVHPNDLQVVHAQHRHNGVGKPQRIDVYFLIKKWTGEVVNKESEFCDDLSWFDLNALPKNMIPFIREIISHVKNNLFYSENGWK